MKNGIFKNEIHQHWVQVFGDMCIFMKEQSSFLRQNEEMIFLCKITPIMKFFENFWILDLMIHNTSLFWKIIFSQNLGPISRSG